MDMIFITNMEQDTKAGITNEYIRHVIKETVEPKLKKDYRPLKPVLIVCSDDDLIGEVMAEFDACSDDVKKENGAYIEMVKNYNHISYLNVKTKEEIDNIFKENIEGDTMFYIYKSDLAITPTDLVELKKQTVLNSGQMVYIYASLS